MMADPFADYKIVQPAAADSLAAASDPFADYKIVTPASAAGKESAHTTLSGMLGSIDRGAAPYAAGALAGGAIGSVVPVVGTAAGAVGGAAAVGLTELADSIYNPIARHTGLPEMMTPTELSDKLLDKVGIKRPSTPAERIAQVASSSAASATSLGLAAERALASTWAEGESFGRAALDMVRGNGAASNAVLGASSGAGAEAAAEAAPDKYKGYAALAGGLTAGGLVAGTTAAVRGIGNIAHSIYQAVTEPAEARAARQIVSHATDPDSLRQTLEDSANADPLVEGSRPTTFQATGDLGVGALERHVAASPSGVAPFAARREQQNAARLDELDKLADPAADPQAVTDYVRSRLQDISDDHAAMVSDAAHGVADSLAKAGGAAFDSHSAYGEALRNPLAALHQNAKDAASTLWRAIDPDMSAPVNISSLKNATAELVGKIPEIAKQPEGEEASILNGIGNLGDAANFGDMVALRGRLTDAMRDERRNGTPTVLRRLAITLSNVDDALANTAGEIAADPVQKQDMLSRIGLALAADRQGWYRQNDVAIPKAVSQDTTAWRNAGANDGGDAALGSGGISPASGREVPVGGGFGNAPGDQGLQATAGIPAEVADRYDTARAATKDLKTKFESGPVGSALAPGAQYGSFKMMTSNVGKTLFDKPEALQAFVDAAGDNPTALAPMRDYAAFSLRQAAVKDGMLSPAKYQQWVDSHGYALRQFPEIADKFSNVQKAQSALDDSLAAQKQALTEYQTSAIKPFLDGQDPTQAAGRALANPGRFSDLVGEVSDDPAATAGLKRAVVDFMMSKSIGTAESGTSGLPQINAATLQKFYLQNRQALSNLFTPAEMDSMARVTADLQRANRSIVAVKIPGGSNTAQDTGLRAMSVLQNVIKQYGAKAAGATLGTSLLGPVGGIGGFLLGAAGDAARAARMDAIDKAVVEMMLDPKMAAAWLAKVPAQPNTSHLNAFARQLRAVTANQILDASDKDDRR